MEEANKSHTISLMHNFYPKANRLRTQKQTYLRQHILEPGLDAEAFLEFLKDQKPGGDNIDSWSLNDLETLTDLFKRTLDPPGEYSEYKMQEIDINDATNVIYSKRFITAEKPATKLTFNPPKELVVEAAEKVEGGFFSSNYLVFPIKFQLADSDGGFVQYCSKRKINDFIWLYESLSNLKSCPEFKDS